MSSDSASTQEVSQVLMFPTERCVMGFDENQEMEASKDKDLFNKFNFWICCDDKFSSSLVCCQSSGALESENKADTYKYSIIDADGLLVNQGEVSFPSDVGEIDLKPFMGSCKTESGLRHGRLELEAPGNSAVMLKLAMEGEVNFISRLSVVKESHSEFVPVSFAKNKVSYFCLTNFSTSALELRIRLILGKRAPELQVSLPAGGSRVIILEQEFAQVLENLEAQVFGYLRISTRDPLGFGFQLIEETENESGKTISCFS